MKRQSVLVCVTGQVGCERLIVAGARLAEPQQARLCVLHVARKGNHVLGYANEAEALEYLLKVSVEHGADMFVVKSDDVLSAIEKQVRELDVVTLVAGRAANYGGWDMLDELKLRIPDVNFEIQ